MSSVSGKRKKKKKKQKLAVTTLRSDLLNFRRGSRRAKRLREMESETVEGLVSSGLLFNIPLGRRFSSFLLNSTRFRARVFLEYLVKECVYRKISMLNPKVGIDRSLLSTNIERIHVINRRLSVDDRMYTNERSPTLVDDRMYTNERSSTLVRSIRAYAADERSYRKLNIAE